jgi:diguanylate cyclase (GGDEF)-like protein
MQTASKRAIRISEAAAAVAARPVRAVEADPAVVALRQDYLDALPVAAAVCRLDDGGRMIVDAANGAFQALSGCEAPVVGRWVGRIPFLQESGSAARIVQLIERSEPAADFEASDGKSVGGRHFDVRLTGLRPAAGLGRRCLVTFLDRTAQLETERNLRAEMLRDSLTGLPNRTAFNEQVEKVLEAPDFQPGVHGVLVVDMSRFSRVNECVGAMAGDELLITFARRLVSALRGGDILARTGGDEFGILLRLDRGIEEALQAAERIRAALSTPYRLSDLEISIDCAIGGTLLSGQEKHPEEALRNAQFATKRAKGSGGVELYEPNQARAVRRRFSIETALRRAVEQQHLRLAFQPLIDLKTGAVAGFEALARWNDESRGPIAPTEFIPVAEESGLIVPLGRWAIDSAIATLAAWDRTNGGPLPLAMSVNLSAIQICRDDVAEIVASALRRHGIAGERLTLELTESAIVHDPARAQSVLDQLKSLHARVAMDDFGTGYTSLAYLQRLPIDVLKIDRSFVSGMIEDQDSTAIVRAVLSLAKSLGMETIAEGIETPELARILTGLGCSHGQGFHFAEPLEPDAAFAYWLSRKA